MIHGKSVLAVIPARGGSKRCPRKNTRPFRGKPLIEWTIEAAQQSQYLDQIVVSTDDAVAAAIALRMNVPIIMRPPELCTDEAKSEDAMRHVLDCYQAHPFYKGLTAVPDWIVLLQPTSPLRIAEDIDACIERAQGKNIAISYVPVNDGFKKNGAVYVCLSSDLKAGLNFDRPASIYMMPESRSLDIDYAEQFDEPPKTNSPSGY